MGVVSLPWVIKPVYGFLTDGLPVFGYRRKPYLILAGLLGSASWASLATVVATPAQAAAATRNRRREGSRGLDPSRVEQAVAASTVASLGVAMSDVVVDSLVVERARMTSPPPLQRSALHGAAWTRRGRTSRRPRARCSRSAGRASPRAASPRPTSPARCSRR